MHLIAEDMKRPAHLDLSRYPHLPQPFVAATRSADYPAGRRPWLRPPASCSSIT